MHERRQSPRLDAPTFLVASFMVSLFLSFQLHADPQPAEDPFAALDAIVEKGMSDWGIPGLALAVIRDDQVVLSRSYGVRTLGGQEAVDEDTLFFVGSATKAFTSTSLGMLVDEGRVGWDDPVVRHLPSFELYDPYVSQTVTVRDLLTHRVGVERADALWYMGNFDAEEILRRIRHLAPRKPFRGGFVYSNLLYIAASRVVARASGQSWESFIEEDIFHPLGMTRSTVGTAGVAHRTNVATAHMEEDGRVVAVGRATDDLCPGAGGIYASATDMTRWLRMHLGNGALEGRRLLAPETADELRSPQVVIPLQGSYKVRFPDAHLLNYGLGWYLHDYRGHFMVEHGGSSPGIHVWVAFLPEEGVGMVIMTNKYPNRFAEGLRYILVDALFGHPPHAWDAEMLAYAEAMSAIWRQPPPEPPGPPPSQPLSNYGGTYRHPRLGDVRIAQVDGSLVLTAGVHRGVLRHLRHDVFRVVYDEILGFDDMSFSFDGEGAVHSVTFTEIGEFVRIDESEEGVNAR